MASQSLQPLPPRRTNGQWLDYLAKRGPLDADNGLANSAGADMPTGATTSPNTEEHDEEWDGQDDDMGQQIIDPELSGNSTLATAVTEMCRLIKKSKSLSEESEREMDIYVSVSPFPWS